MNKLLKEAIADAKAVRETALANAKAALEEAFAPKLQSMLSHKIKEEMENTEEEEGVEEEMPEANKMKELAGLVSEEDMESEEEEISDEEMTSDEEEMSSDEEEMGSDEMEMTSDEDEMEDMESEEEEISDEELEEILAELESVDDNAEKAQYEAEDPEAKEEDMVDEEINLDELINTLREEEGTEPTEDEDELEAELAGDRAAQMEAKKAKMKMKKMEEELNEAYSAVKFLRSKLNEVNLLNAKLLFVNKIFRKQALSEAQKVKIIETFDRATSVREAKLIYATLTETTNNVKVKKDVKLNEGFASKPQKGTNVIPQTNELYKRFSELINYNPNN